MTFLTSTARFRFSGGAARFLRISGLPTVILLSFTLILGSRAVIAEPVRVGHLTAELVSEVESVQPGTQFWAGLYLILDDDWHVYWRNPGAAGLPPKITWNLPEGCSAGQILWPGPQRFETGPLASFGYHGAILLPVKITVSDDLAAERVVLKAEARWLVCKEECIPGEADLILTLPVSGDPPKIDPRCGATFSETRNSLPKWDHGWEVDVSARNRDILLTVKAPTEALGSGDNLYFFPHQSGLLNLSMPQAAVRTDSGTTITLIRNRNNFSLPDRLSGVLAVHGLDGDGPGIRNFGIQVPFEAPDAASVALEVTESGGLSVWLAILFALAGGMFLNLMPCVLPVLSLKVLSFVEKAGESRKTRFSHGAAFTSGVVMSFLVLAGLLLALRAGGSQIGWGFQLQSPAFLVVLATFMFLFGLSLLGVFEIGSSMTALGGPRTQKGLAGSFLTGVTATVVATPCTAPFMGSALGYSLVQPPTVSLLIFASLGIGMAAPYVVLSAWPGLLRIVPKPGRWMESFKQFMGFLLLATVVWLAWVLGLQTGSYTVVALLATLLLAGLGGWVYGRWGTPVLESRTRLLGQTVSVVLVAIGLAVGLAAARDATNAPSVSSLTSSGTIEWEQYTEARYTDLRRSGRPIFIDFTAAWCLSCQMNEQVAFGSEKVQKAFERLDIATLKADWTLRDEETTRALARYGRNSVPLYVLYAPGQSEPHLLPEILTPGIVLEALELITDEPERIARK
jgi:thiol:disulfide interchange protein DsbD